MKGETKDLVRALGIDRREHVALVGAGGKTTLMFALAEELRSRGSRVLTGTTTKVRQEQAESARQVILTDLDSRWRDTLERAIMKNGLAFIASKPAASGKVQGIAPGLADELFEQSGIDYMVLEADGAKGKLIKAPAQHEPVVPVTATAVIGLIGADALGRPCSREDVFRVEKFMEITGARKYETITPEMVAKLAVHEEGLFKGCPGAAKRVIFINRMDLAGDRKLLQGLTELLRDSYRVVTGSLKKGLYLVYDA